jgi:hypothetical protein
MSHHPPGAILVASGDLLRYPGFTISLLHLMRPEKTEVIWNAGLNPAANFNGCIRRMRSHHEWAWIMGDDHVLPPDCLMRLLDRNVDVVVPLCVRRQPPFIPVLFKQQEADSPLGQFPPIKWSEVPSSGLHECWVVGSAGMLVRRRVLEAIQDPWFEIGQMATDRGDEDTHFCLKVQQAGFKIHFDADVVIGHITPICLWPAKGADGKWTVSLDLGKYMDGSSIRANLPSAWLSGVLERVKENATR